MITLITDKIIFTEKGEVNWREREKEREREREREREKREREGGGRKSRN